MATSAEGSLRSLNYAELVIKLFESIKEDNLEWATEIVTELNEEYYDYDFVHYRDMISNLRPQDYNDTYLYVIENLICFNKPKDYEDSLFVGYINYLVVNKENEKVNFEFLVSKLENNEFNMNGISGLALDKFITFMMRQNNGTPYIHRVHEVIKRSIENLKTEMEESEIE